jgi:heat shock protein HslJ
MTPSLFSARRSRIHSSRQRWLHAWLGLALLGSLGLGCGAQFDSTDTGNPPVIIGQKLRLVPSGLGVVVVGEPGAVTAGAQVQVVNVSTNRSQTTTAAPDGSFEVEIEGTLADEYRVQASLGGQSSSTGLSSSGSGPSGLAGLEFLLESSEGYTPVAGTTIRLWFEASEFGFSAGCNSHRGPYSLCDGRLCSSGLGSTQIGCGASLQGQDEWLAAFLTASPLLTHAAPRLTLEGTAATLEFLDRELANPDRPLTGRTWTIDTFIDGGGASSFPLQAPPTVEFRDDRSLRVFTSCNVGEGTYTLGEGVLVLSTVAYTEEGCGPPGSVAAEDRIVQVLAAGTVSYDIEAARLTLLRGTLGLSATTD